MTANAEVRQVRARWVCLAAMAAALLISPARQSAAQVPLETELCERLRARLQALDKLVVEYDWSECRAFLKDDPFDKSIWIYDKMSHTRQCRAWILRPHVRIRFFSSIPGLTDVDRNWVDGVCTSKGIDPQGHWHVQLYPDRDQTTGPYPLITPLELWQTFDIGLSLLEMVESEKLRVQSWTPERVVVAGGPIDPNEPWTVRVELDVGRGFLPVEIGAELRMPGAPRGGLIRWQMRTLGSQPIRGVHAISEAVLALSNTYVNQEKFQIYYYQMRRIQHERSLSKSQLRIDIPAVNVSLIDEVNLFARRIDAQGRILREEHWTREERQKQLEALGRTWQRSQESERLLASRRTLFWGMVGGSAGSVAIAAGVWLWARRAWSVRRV